MSGTLLTIDWDFFVYSDLTMDGLCTGGFISPSLTATLWALRPWTKDCVLAEDSLIDAVCTEICSRIPVPRRANLTTIVTESHDAAYFMAQEFKTKAIVSLDRHHDLGYRPLDSVDDVFLGHLNPTNWLAGALCDEQLKPQVRVFTPPNLHSLDAREMRRDRRQVASAYGCGPSERLRIASFRPEDLGRELDRLPPIRAIHLCRSPEWCPPAHDKAFNRLCQRLGAKRSSLIPARNPVSPERLDEARERIRAMDEKLSHRLGFSVITGNPLPRLLGIRWN